MKISVDTELAKELRRDFTVEKCASSMMDSIEEMLSAVGVQISWSITFVNPEQVVEKDKLKKAMGRYATASGALLLGSRVNPLKDIQGHKKSCEGCDE